MRPCKRCGIDIDFAGLCDDCVDVTGDPRKARTFMVPKEGGYTVKTDRPVGGRVAGRRALMRYVRDLNARGMSANEIALEVGVTTRTVQRWRKSLGIHGLLGPSDGFSYVRDQDAARAKLSRLMNEVNKKRMN